MPSKQEGGSRLRRDWGRLPLSPQVPWREVGLEWEEGLELPRSAQRKWLEHEPGWQRWWP